MYAFASTNLPQSASPATQPKIRAMHSGKNLLAAVVQVL
jgi:hypothetical protein